VAGLYVHVPFRRGAQPTDESDYLVTENPDVSRFETALRQELRYYAQDYADDEPIRTVYAGGGRPSLLPLSSVHAILTTLLDIFDASQFEEATAEVNPADATPRYLHGLARLGVDRLSLSVQSFFPGVLQSIDAPHTAADTMRALQLAREAHFNTLSADLLFGAPHQSLNTWEATLRQAVEMGVPHLTITEYPTTSEDSEALRADQLKLAMRMLQSEGYEQYELTHFAQPDHRSAHQKNYYAHGNYLGIGPSAESFWWPDRSGPSRAQRWSNVSDLDRYATLLDQRSPPASDQQPLDRKALAQEYILLRLRTRAGLDLHRLKDTYGVDLWALKKEVIDRLIDENLIHNDGDTVRLTLQGRLVTDAIIQRLLPS
jgi:oxygen-independent coproporphyrinogen-3 oxidase